MLTSVRWINDYLAPPATAEEQAELATRAGFPLEGREDVELPGSAADVRQDFEMTSNRGDCVSHVGLAREIAAISGRTLKMPTASPASGTDAAADAVTVTNHEKRLCPLYTARIITGAKVGPSPDWLAERLIARGDIPRNCVVDATNFVLFELGQPTHVFDLDTLRGSQIIVRMAKDGEPFLPIGEGEPEVALTADDLVIADAERAVAIAGVKGGALTAVTDGSTNLLLEAASFDPVTVRTTSRRHNIASDSSYRFERGVHPGQVNAAADRLAAIILDVAGGTLLDGVVADGDPIPGTRAVSMRTDRCRKILGVPVTDEKMMDGFARLGMQPTLAGDRIECVVPVFRLDIEREIDLIEEVGRMFGHDSIPVQDTMSVRVTGPQSTEMAKQAVAAELVGMGFVETVTHSLVGDHAAEPFLGGEHALRVDDERAKAEPVLQPSLLPSLLRVRRHNRDNGVERLRLFESAATFRGTADGHHERVMLGLVMDVDDESAGLRPMRGTIERLVDVVCGHDTTLTVEADDETSWLAPGARCSLDGTHIGVLGMLSTDAAARFGLEETGVLVAEIDLAQFYADYPPETEAHALPSFPAIERDLSVVLDENVTWSRIAEQVSSVGPDHLEASSFVTTFRGKQIPAGRKSLTFRLRFRASDRTLTHDEVDPQVEAVVAALERSFDAEVRK